MVRPRRMEVWSSAGNNLTMVATLSGDEMASVASLVDVHPGVNICPKDLLTGSSVAVLTWLFNSFFAGRCCWSKLLGQAPSLCIISQHMDRNLLWREIVSFNRMTNIHPSIKSLPLHNCYLQNKPKGLSVKEISEGWEHFCYCKRLEVSDAYMWAKISIYCITIKGSRRSMNSYRFIQQCLQFAGRDCALLKWFQKMKLQDNKKSFLC